MVNLNTAENKKIVIRHWNYIISYITPQDININVFL